MDTLTLSVTFCCSSPGSVTFAGMLCSPSLNATSLCGRVSSTEPSSFAASFQLKIVAAAASIVEPSGSTRPSTVAGSLPAKFASYSFSQSTALSGTLVAEVAVVSVVVVSCA